MPQVQSSKRVKLKCVSQFDSACLIFYFGARTLSNEEMTCILHCLVTSYREAFPVTHWRIHLERRMKRIHVRERSNSKGIWLRLPRTSAFPVVIQEIGICTWVTVSELFHLHTPSSLKSIGLAMLTLVHEKNLGNSLLDELLLSRKLELASAEGCTSVIFQLNIHWIVLCLLRHIFCCVSTSERVINM